MIPNTDKQVNIRRSSGDLKSRQMGIDVNSLEHIVGILTNLYADPALAVIRELSSNAYDSHLQSGQSGRPIEAILPTQINPEFVVRDYGVGLSEDEVFNIYGQYGASTKRADSKATGMLGLGAKAPLSYTNSFSLETIKNGTKNIFTVHLNREGLPSITKLFETKTDEGNGVMVKVPVHDVHGFNVKASEFYSFFPHVEGFQKVNLLRELIPGVHLLAPDKSYIVMGGVPYPFESDIPVMVEAPMGAVDFTPSREALHMTKRTKDFLESTMAEITAGIVDMLEGERSRLKDVHELHTHIDQNYPLYQYLGYPQANITFRGITYATYSRNGSSFIPLVNKNFGVIGLQGRYYGSLFYKERDSLVVVESEHDPSNYTRGRIRMWLEQNNYKLAILVPDAGYLRDEYGVKTLTEAELRAQVKSPKRQTNTSRYTFWEKGSYEGTDTPPEKGVDIVMSRENIKKLYVSETSADQLPFITQFTFYAVPTTRQEKFHTEHPGLIHEGDFLEKVYLPFLRKRFPSIADWVYYEKPVDKVRRVIHTYGMKGEHFSDPEVRELIEIAVVGLSSSQSHILHKALRRLKDLIPGKNFVYGLDRVTDMYASIVERYPLVWGEDSLRNLILDYSEEQYRKEGNK